MINRAKYHAKKLKKALLDKGYVESSLSDFVACIKERRRESVAPLVDTSAERFFGTLEPVAFARVKERLQTGTGHFSTETYLRQQHRADWQQTRPDIQRFAARFIELWRKQNVPLYVHGAFRSKEDQMSAYKKGRSELIWPHAPHCQGAAVDIVHSLHHWQMTEQEWALMGKIGKNLADRLELDIEWGGDWSFYDPAHWQMRDWDQSITYTETGDPVRRSARALLHKNYG